MQDCLRPDNEPLFQAHNNTTIEPAQNTRPGHRDDHARQPSISLPPTTPNVTIPEVPDLPELPAVPGMRPLLNMNAALTPIWAEVPDIANLPVWAERARAKARQVVSKRLPATVIPSEEGSENCWVVISVFPERRW